MNQRQAASVVAALASAFPAWPPSRETVAVYVDCLLDLDYGEAMDATRDLIMLEERFPSVASIRRRVASRAGVLAPTGLEAWAEVTEQSSNGGRSRSPEWSHPAIADTVRAVGWYTLCSSTNPEAMRAQFLRLYDDGRRARDEQTLTGSLETRKAIPA